MRPCFRVGDLGDAAVLFDAATLLNGGPGFISLKTPPGTAKKPPPKKTFFSVDKPDQPYYILSRSNARVAQLVEHNL
ncbi:MAG: hypothetical protein KDD63_13005, partial [Bacteroidetes bacterium]|nr:hypothetical protein [Bacteroidota bacterium]